MQDASASAVLWLSEPPAHRVVERDAELALVNEPVHLQVPPVIHVQEEGEPHRAVVLLHRGLRDALRPREFNLRTHGHESCTLV